MAYSIKTIDTTNYYTWLSSLKTILDELDVDYFDSTVLNVDRESSPIVNELEIKKGDRVICKINGRSLDGSSGNALSLYALEASVTTTLMLTKDANVIITNNSVSIMMGAKGIIFTKTQTDKNAIICYKLDNDNSRDWAMTYEDTVVPTYPIYENKTGILTQILPVLFNSPEGEYSPHVYFAVRTQSTENSTFRQITLNNRNFLTNGNLCLEI